MYCSPVPALFQLFHPSYFNEENMFPLAYMVNHITFWTPIAQLFRSVSLHLLVLVNLVPLWSVYFLAPTFTPLYMATWFPTAVLLPIIPIAVSDCLPGRKYSFTCGCDRNCDLMIALCNFVMTYASWRFCGWWILNGPCRFSSSPPMTWLAATRSLTSSTSWTRWRRASNRLWYSKNDPSRCKFFISSMGFPNNSSPNCAWKEATYSVQDKVQPYFNWIFIYPGCHYSAPPFRWITTPLSFALSGVRSILK